MLRTVSVRAAAVPLAVTERALCCACRTVCMIYAAAAARAPCVRAQPNPFQHVTHRGGQGVCRMDNDGFACRVYTAIPATPHNCVLHGTRGTLSISTVLVPLAPPPGRRRRRLGDIWCEGWSCDRTVSHRRSHVRGPSYPLMKLHVRDIPVYSAWTSGSSSTHRHRPLSASTSSRAHAHQPTTWRPCRSEQWATSLTTRRG